MPVRSLPHEVGGADAGLTPATVGGTKSLWLGLKDGSTEEMHTTLSSVKSSLIRRPAQGRPCRLDGHSGRTALFRSVRLSASPGNVP